MLFCACFGHDCTYHTKYDLIMDHTLNEYICISPTVKENRICLYIYIDDEADFVIVFVSHKY